MMPLRSVLSSCFTLTCLLATQYARAAIILDIDDDSQFFQVIGQNPGLSTSNAGGDVDNVVKQGP